MVTFTILSRPSVHSRRIYGVLICQVLASFVQPSVDVLFRELLSQQNLPRESRFMGTPLSPDTPEREYIYIYMDRWGKSAFSASATKPRYKYSQLSAIRLRLTLSLAVNPVSPRIIYIYFDNIFPTISRDDNEEIFLTLFKTMLNRHLHFA